VGRAVSSIDILDRAVVVANLADAVADCGLVIGASARSRRIPWPMLTPSECANRVLKEKKSNKIALVFGREDSGLSNGELQQCNFHVQIPTSEEYTSLNLASAVMVVCYELRKAWLAMEGEVSGDDELWDIERATGEQLEHFYEHLERVLIAIEFHDPDNPRQLMSRLRRLFGRVRMDAMEMNIMRGILSNIEYHIKSSD